MGAAPRAGPLTRGKAWICAAALWPVEPALAQPQAETRAEAVATGTRRVEAGLGMSVRASPYLRAGLSAAHAVWARGDARSTPWRTDALMRFTMDPFAEHRWGVSLGGGLGYQGRVYLLGVAEIEGPSLSGVRPAARMSLGGGLRFGLLLRRAVAGRR